VREGADAFQELKLRLLDLFGRGVEEPLSDQGFNEMALGAFRLQCKANPAYRAFVVRRGVDAEEIGRWEEIPPLPARAFKSAPLMVGDPARAEAVFRTSGTTRGEGERGRHFVRALDLYRASLLPNFRAHLFPEGGGLPVLALLPDPKVAPDSSLSFMVGEVIEALSRGRGEFFVDPRTGIRTMAFDQALKAAEGAGEPVLLAGTALAFDHWLETAEREGWRYRLPGGSRIMETGGFNSRARALPREELYAGLEGSFGVPQERMVNEYGMTELLSQFYEPILTVGAEATTLFDDVSGSPGTEGEIGLAERHHRDPPWVRTRALHPLTLDPVPEGDLGILAHWDLANLGSVSAVLTEDLGRLVPGGFRLQGRSPDAEPRGCSLAMDDFLVGVKGGI